MWRTIGHDWAVGLLQREIEANHVAHAYLMTGPANIGKTSLAKELAAALNCTGDSPPCGSCGGCKKTARGIHPDLIIVEPADGRIKIDQIRALQHELALSPFEGQWKVCIITEFQTATVEAANALLKTLEEPAPKVVIVLTATDASSLLPTIVSRCRVLPLRGVAAQQIERALVDRYHEREDVARLLAGLAAGCIGWAIRAAEDPSVLARRRRDIDGLLALSREGRSERIRAAEELSKREDLAAVLRLWQTWWRDIMFVCCGCEELIVNLDYLDALRRQGRDCDVAQATAALRGGESALQQLEQNVNARLCLEVLLLSWGQLSVIRLST